MKKRRLEISGRIKREILNEIIYLDARRERNETTGDYFQKQSTSLLQKRTFFFFQKLLFSCLASGRRVQFQTLDREAETTGLKL